jgi:hypothetical protein
MQSVSVKYTLTWCFLFLLSSNVVFAQNPHWEHIRRIDIDNPDLISTDGRGNIYISDEKGILRQFDPNGDSLNIYSPAFTSKLDKLECHWTVNIFLFSADLQRYELLDRFLNPLSSQQIQLPSSGIIKAVTLGNNHMLWLFDETGMSLKKMDYRRNQIVQEQPLGLVLPGSSLEIVDISERKNMLFLQVKNEGVYIFDNQGNFIKQTGIPLEKPNVIENNHMYGVHNGHITKTNYLTGDSSKIALPDASYGSLALSKDRVILSKKGQVDIFVRPSDL